MAEAQTLPAAEPAPPEIDPNQPVSIEIGDQVFTGVGETEASLREGLDLPKPQTDRKPSRGQKRYDELTREREDAKREADAAKKEAADLKAQIEALSKPVPAATAQPAPAAVQPPQAPQPPAAKKPSWRDFEAQIGTKFETWADAQDAFTDAREDFLRSQFDAQIRTSIEADRASRTFVEQINATRAEARKVHSDFDAVLQTVDDVMFPGPILELIANAPNSGLLQYRLAKNRPLAEKIARMQNLGMVGYELAQLMADPAVAPSASTADPVVHVPPPPMQPVGSGSKTTVLSASDLADRGGEDYDSSGFREQLRKERGRR